MEGQEPQAKRQNFSGEHLASYSNRDGEADEKHYFKTYSDLYVHEEMLRDFERTSKYRSAIMENSHLLNGKVVADIGAGTGILSCFCAQAGAKKVYAIEGSDAAEHARRVVQSNNLEDCITVIHGMVEECQLPEKVDVIVSEWMGYFLMYESMLSSVLYAREQWLKPDGVMLPSHASIFVAPVRADNFWEDRVNCWSRMKDAYGVDMSCLTDVVMRTTLRSVQVVQLDGEDIIGDSTCVLSLDLKSTTQSDLEKLVGTFKCQCHCSAPLHGLGVWFVVTFPGKPPVLLSTSPYAVSTHWRQCVLFLNAPTNVVQDDIVEGSLTLSPCDHTTTLCSWPIQTLHSHHHHHSGDNSSI
ncbi:protein arginine N-methyltransferase 6-like isoform X1 [Sycon ciliatum]|uniref:protein arginine N-methyltransferase 6-like isoform X1 n=1 Tax=Sycon ciliatum TaxID=27933 RepID=UPI0031F61A9F